MVEPIWSELQKRLEALEALFLNQRITNPASETALGRSGPLSYALGQYPAVERVQPHCGLFFLGKSSL